ncbi:3-dehydroshikimate dehydratase [Xylariaceae sp. FL0255]|nr:3-dehydroshikimate dehydratase [Xylariaceae sp. FL0255]
MPLTYKGAEVPTSFATCSIGHSPEHTLPRKLEAIAAAGFDGIGLAMPDLLAHGASLALDGKEPDPANYDTLVLVGRDVRALAQRNGLRILMLQPFANFEGWGKGSSERADAFARAEGWLRVAEAVGADLLQVGSSDSPGIESATFDTLAADFAELADLAASRGIRVAYENWCWATRAPRWKDVWDIVKKADRPNLGLCLDTFQSAGGEWGSPTTASGLVDNTSGGGKKGEEAVFASWADSLRELSATVPPEKIFLLQISDAYKMSPPLPDKIDENGLRPRGQWSHDYRPLPYDGGYLPVKDFLHAVLGTGFRGWLSIEVFDGKAADKYDDMREFSQKAIKSLETLLKD